MNVGMEIMHFSERLLHANPEAFFNLTKSGKFYIKYSVVVFHQKMVDLLVIAKKISCANCESARKFEYISCSNKQYLHCLIKRNVMASISMYSSYTCKVRAYFEEHNMFSVLFEWSASLPCAMIQ